MRMIAATDLVASTQPAVCDEWRCTLRLRFAGITVEVRTSEFALKAELCKKYAAHVCYSEPDALFFAVRTAEGYRFSGAAGSWEWRSGPLPADALAFLTDAALLSAVIRSSDLLSMHAAAIEFAGRGAAIAGASTAGKTTTLLACARAGARVYSDERALLRDGQLQPFLRRCSVRDGGRDLLLQDDANDALADRLRSSPDLDLRDCFGRGAVAAPAALDAVFVLSGCGENPAIRRIAPAQALTAVTKWFDMRGGMLERAARALEVLHGAHCYEVQLGSPAATARAILAAMEALQ